MILVENHNTFFQSVCDFPVDNSHLEINSALYNCPYPCHKISDFSIFYLQRYSMCFLARKSAKNNRYGSSKTALFREVKSNRLVTRWIHVVQFVERWFGCWNHLCDSSSLHQSFLYNKDIKLVVTSIDLVLRSLGYDSRFMSFLVRAC